MTHEPRQDNKEGRADSPLHKAWVSLTTTLGMPLTVALAVIVGMIIVVLAVGLIWYLIPIFGFKNGLTITQRKDLVQGLASVVQALAVVLTGTVGLIGLLFTWRNLSQTRESTQRSLELTEQGQITERFTRAIDQLGETDDNGDPRLEIRLGGIYALERIDQESPDRAYHPTVMEVLTAYVRENAPWPPKSSKSPERGFVKPPARDSVSNSSPNVAAEQVKAAVHGVEPTSEVPPADIQAILTVIARRKGYYGNGETEPLDLQGTDLRGSSALGGGGVHLERAYLRGANLRGANLRGVDLQGANLQEANLQDADLYGADLEASDLEAADLQRADDITQDQIESTIGSSETKLPEGLNHPELWSKSPEEQMDILLERINEEQMNILLERLGRAESRAESDSGK